jgi:hypothetical protein
LNKATDIIEDANKDEFSDDFEESAMDLGDFDTEEKAPE